MRIVPLACLLLCLVTSPAEATDTTVHDNWELHAAVETAAPGDVITVAPGIYDMNWAVMCNASGTAEAPIVVRATALSEALLRIHLHRFACGDAEEWRVESIDVC